MVSMMKNIYEDEFIQLIRLKYNDSVEIITDSSQHCRLIEKRFPFSGSKISWEQVPNSINIYLKDEEKLLITVLDLISELEEKDFINSKENIIVVGDGQFDFSYKLELEDLKTILKKIIDLPQHLYLMQENANWVLAVTSQRYIGFGEAIFFV